MATETEPEREAAAPADATGGAGRERATRIVDRHHGSLTVESRTEHPAGRIFHARFLLHGER